MARAICQAEGFEPDKCMPGMGYCSWRNYIDAAKAALQAYEKFDE